MTALLFVALENTAYSQFPSVSGLQDAKEQRDAEMDDWDDDAPPPAAAPAAAAPAAPETEQAAPAVAAPVGNNILQRGWWGPGNYFSPIKMSLYVLVFLCWVYSASWMNCDMERLKNPNREQFNLGYLLLFSVLGIGSLFIPIFWASFPVFLLLWVVPISVYVVQRNAPLPPHEKVMTGEHLYFLFAVLMNKFGVKIKVKQRMKYEAGPPIELEAAGKKIDSSVLQGRLILARNAPGYNDFRQCVYDAILSHADALMFDFTPERTVVRHQVDGVWLDLEPIPRVIEKGKTKDAMEEMLEAAKMLIGGNPNDRRSRQAGSFLAKRSKKLRYDADFLSQGTQTGEAVMIQFTAKKVPFQTLEDLGIRPDQKEKLLGLLNAPKGLFVVSAAPANGLRSSMDVFSRVCDRFTRDVVNVEDAFNPTEPVENITLAQYDSSQGETPMKVLPDVLFKEPHALFVRDMTDPETMQRCCEEIDHDRLFVTMIRAKDGVEAIQRFLALNIPKQQFLSKISGVSCQRLIRKLCPACKEPYQPAPQLLSQLRLQPNQVKEFYRTRTPLPEQEEKKRGVCETCNGIGYHGRTALFEIFVISDAVREMLLAGANANEIRQQLVKEGQANFLSEGIRLLIQGETTVEEFSRVMKQ